MRYYGGDNFEGVWGLILYKDDDIYNDDDIYIEYLIKSGWNIYYIFTVYVHLD